MSSNENDDPAQIGMRIRGANGQTADLLAVEQYDGTDVFKVDKDGYVTKQFDPDAASYIVWKSGSTYYAKSGADGSIFSSGSDAATLINAVIAIIPSNGGTIRFKEGDYALTGGLSLNGKNNVVLEGAAHGWPGISANGTNFIRTGDFDMFTITATGRVYEVVVRGITFTHSSGSGHGVVVDKALHVEFDHCTFYRIPGNSIKVTDTYGANIHHCIFDGCGTAGVYADVYCLDGGGAITVIHVHHNVFEDSTYYAIHTTNATNYVRIYDNYFESTVSGTVTGTIYTAGPSAIERNWIYWGSRSASGYVIRGGGWGTKVINNYVYRSSGGGIDCSNGQDHVIAGNLIDLDGANNTGATAPGLKVGKRDIVSNNVVENCWLQGIYTTQNNAIITNNLVRNNAQSVGALEGIYLLNQYCVCAGNRVMDDQTGVETQTRGIKEDSTADYNLIMGNTITGATSVAVGKTGANTVISHNMGYKTDADGSATVTATNTYVAVTHGLASTPALGDIQITPQGSLLGRTFWVSDVGATTFRINMSTSDTIDHIFSWSAVI